MLVKLGLGALSSERQPLFWGSFAEGSGILAGRRLNRVGRVRWCRGEPSFRLLFRGHSFVAREGNVHGWCANVLRFLRCN